MLFVILYLAAIVAANLITARFGPWASVFNAFALIGLDLTARDVLHDKWAGRWLWLKMTLLIGSGSLLAYAVNRDAGPIALASFLAFALAGIVDAVTYQLLGERSKLVRVNGSNVFAAAVDSVVFPLVAFGAMLPLIMLGQFAAKVLGGFVWSIIIIRMRVYRGVA